VRGVESIVTASDTRTARERIRSHKPDVILLSLDLHHQDAMPFLSRLREYYPVPVLVMGASGLRAGRQAQSAIANGALDAFVRPDDLSPASLEAFAVRVVEAARVAARKARPRPATPTEGKAPEFVWSEVGIDPAQHVIAIGASTGGTEATLALLRALPSDGPPILIVQHMPPIFTRSYAARLDRLTMHHVREAGSRQVLKPGEAWVAPGDYHLAVSRVANGWIASTNQGPAVNLHRPSAEVLFSTMAKHVGDCGIGFILTGMGADGAEGLLQLRRSGGLTFGQSRASCVVYGMPCAAAQLGAVISEAAPDNLPQLLVETWRNKQRATQRGKKPSVQRPASISRT
jgi:two-component system chemotaxis response regulator CheB